MAYATLDQLVSLFGADEIRTLSDRQGTGELDEAVISDALERASSEVDSYLADRYATPLSGSDPIPPVVVSVTGDIARYRLTGGIHNIQRIIACFDRTCTTNKNRRSSSRSPTCVLYQYTRNFTLNSLRCR